MTQDAASSPRSTVESLHTALYLHIPFCASRCAYCDFNTYAGLEALFEPYVSALVREIRQTGAAAGHPSARTLFVGGGTPTVLPVRLLAHALEACFSAFDIAPAAEITCEANPGTADQAHFASLRALGVNRLSLGVQSFDDHELSWLGRIHTALEAGRAFSEARAAGFDNINLDLIFGLPEQDPSTWQHTLARAVDLGPEHLSLYSLTVEYGTPLGRRVRHGQVSAPDDDLAADLYDIACDTLAAHGYDHYEISNWARSRTPGDGSSNVDHTSSSTTNRRYPMGALSSTVHCCQHNLVYWRHEPYLGFGAGAYSCDGSRRWWNVRSVPRYVARVEARRAPRVGSEHIDHRLAMAETMMLGLRLLEEGVPRERFRARFAIELEEAFGAEVSRLVALGLLERLPERVRLTRPGWLLGNRVFAEFMDSERTQGARRGR